MVAHPHSRRRLSCLVTLVAGLCCTWASARAQDATCPAAGVADRFVCFETGDVSTAANRTSLVYTPTRAFVAGSEICAFVDVLAELEEGGWDQVFLRFSAGGDALGTSFVDHCLAGDQPLTCDSNLSPGCESLPTVTYDASGNYCWQPPPGTTSVTISVYVKTLDGEYQCGECPSGGSPGVTVERLEITGCNGFPTPSTCGDGTVDAAEGCDDGNTVGLDGCSATCAIEAGAICNAARTACGVADGCDAVTPGALTIDYCYENGDTLFDSPLAWTWRVAPRGGPTGDPLQLAFDISGGLELFTSDGESFDALWFSWEDDLGGFDLFPLNFGQGMTEDVAFEVWSRGVLEITPTPGATRVTATFLVEADGSFSCAQNPDMIDPLRVHALSLASCAGRVVTSYESFNAFTDALSLKGCYTVLDFNDRPDGELGPFFGDGFIADTDSPEGIALSVEDSPYPSTFAAGDGTPALDPQIPESYLSNSRLRVDFFPSPAKAIGMTFVDVGDIDGVMGLEAYSDGRLVHFDPDIGVGSPDNNHIAWRGFVFDQPVDAIVFSMLQPADHFNLDNLVVVPQDDLDDDGVPDLCDCAPDEPDVAGSFNETCDDLLDNDCDGLTDDSDGDCGGSGTTTCSTYANVPLDADNGGWLVSGDTAWSWAPAADGRWAASSANNLDATLETAPLTIPAGACPGDFKIDLTLGGVVSADGDALVVSWAKNGGAFVIWKSLTGTLSPDTLDLTGSVVPGDLVSLRLLYKTNASGVASGPSVAGLRLFSDEDEDLDGVCDGCDCAPANGDYGEDCDGDGDGWCADDSGPLNANPLYAGCDLELAGGDPQVSGSDCDDAAATANPSNTVENPFCGDARDNDCDGAVDDADSDCAAPECTDPDGDGYGEGACLGVDCREGVATCTTDCADIDDDGTPECDPEDDCVDIDDDGFGGGAGCFGGDCDDGEARCAVDCATDLDSDRIPDCAETCVDSDDDGFGSGPGCSGLDCDDGSALCTTNCADSDSDQVPDCRDGCLDADRDGHGTGATCAAADCDDTRPTCTTTCADGNANNVPDCGENCQDGDGDGFGVGTGCSGPDCAEGVAACNVLCRDVDGDQVFDCDPADDCIDKDGDGYGLGSGCDGNDCDDGLASCTTDCVDVDEDQRLDCDPADSCIDVDRDGFGIGSGCSGGDCDDAIATCAVDCTTDADGDRVPDCAQTCIDGDGDGFGVGPGCEGADCDDGVVACTTSCVDVDLDQVPDCADPCLDADGDGRGEGAGCSGSDCDDDRPDCGASCADNNGNGTPDCAEDCADVDGDGYGVGSTCLGADCDDGQAKCAAECVDRDTDSLFDCADGCLDVDRDGYGVGPDCAGADCDDTLRTCTVVCADGNGNDIPDCNEGCRDQDQDGFGVGADCTEVDCDDRYPVCTTQCAHSDQDGIPDCADEDDDQDALLDIDEGRFGANPFDPDSDDDGLLDGAEVQQYQSDPTNPDSDGDGINDGDEVTFHATSPTNPDSDGGGVGDGVEVGRGTNPLDPADDGSVGEYQGGGGCAGGAGADVGLLLLLAGGTIAARRYRVTRR